MAPKAAPSPTGQRVPDLQKKRPSAISRADCFLIRILKIAQRRILIILALLYALFEIGSEVNQIIEIEIEKDQREIQRLRNEQRKARARN